MNSAPDELNLFLRLLLAIALVIAGVVVYSFLKGH